MNIFLNAEERKKVIEVFFSGKQKPHWPTSEFIQAFLVTVPYLYQVNDKTIPPGQSWQCTTKTGDTFLGVNPKHSGKASTSIDLILQTVFNKREAK